MMIRFVDRELSGYVHNVLRPYRSMLDSLLEGHLRGYDAYLFGSAATYPVIEYVHGVRLIPSDLDIGVDDTGNDLDTESFATDTNMELAAWKCPRVIVEDQQIDIVPFSMAFIKPSVSLVNFLHTRALNVHQVVYDLRNDAWFDDGALAAVENRVVDAIQDDYKSVARALYFAEKTGFEVGEATLRRVPTDDTFVSYLEYLRSRASAGGAGEESTRGQVGSR